MIHFLNEDIREYKITVQLHSDDLDKVELKKYSVLVRSKNRPIFYCVKQVLKIRNFGQ